MSAHLVIYRHPSTCGFTGKLNRTRPGNVIEIISVHFNTGSVVLQLVSELLRRLLRFGDDVERVRLLSHVIGPFVNGVTESMSRNNLVVKKRTQSNSSVLIVRTEA